MLVSRRTDRRPRPEDPAVAVIRPEGDLDALEAPDIRRTALALPPGTRLVIDLGATTFIDSVGVGLLIGVSRAVAANGGSTVLAAPRQPVARVLQVTGVAEILPVVKSPEQAFRLLDGQPGPPAWDESLSPR